jgi:hypothetical protein
MTIELEVVVSTLWQSFTLPVTLAQFHGGVQSVRYHCLEPWAIIEASTYLLLKCVYFHCTIQGVSQVCATLLKLI